VSCRIIVAFRRGVDEHVAAVGAGDAPVNNARVAGAGLQIAEPR
jgi:hypothetical protein